MTEEDKSIETDTNPSGEPRWDIEESLNNEFSGAPDAALYLGGCVDSDGDDVDLWLLTWTDDEPCLAWSMGERDDEGEPTGPADRMGNSVLPVGAEVGDGAVLREAERRARRDGYLPAVAETDPKVLPKAFLDHIQARYPAISVMGHVYLGKCPTPGGIARLYWAQLAGPAPSPYVVFSVMGEKLAGQWWSDGSIPSHLASQLHLREAICRVLDKGLPYTLRGDSLAALRQVVRIPDPDHKKKEDPETMKSEEGSTQIVKGKKKFSHVTVSTSKDEEIHLPEGMSKAQARDWLTKIEQAEEQKINWSESFDAYPLDGALALRRVLERRFGSAVKEGATQNTFFGEKEVPPYMIALETGVDTTEYVPWGYFVIPPMPDCKIRTGLNYANKQLVFTLSGEIKRKYKPLMDDISVQLREQLATGSIYKGKAFRLNFASREEQEAEGYNPFDYMPRFINTSSTSDKLILSDKVREQIETNIFTPVEHTDTCRKLGVPIKRGILLEGRYGVGKSLTAHVLSRVCVENGWTFIYLQNVMALEDAMRFAKRYEPAVIFAEDIDGAMQQKEGSARDQAMNAILNTIDGVDMKKSEQMVVLTTNFVDRINKAMLRPGRLDAVISVDPPDEGAVIQLLKHYARGLLDKIGDDDLRPAAALLAGQIPSVIREVVERSKLASIRRAAGKQDGALLAGDDLRVAAQGIMSHIALLRESEPDKRSDIEKAADRLAHGLMKGSSNGRSDKSSPVVDLQRFGGTTS